MAVNAQTAAAPRATAPPWWSLAEVAATERTEAWEDTLARNYRRWQVPSRVDAGFSAQLRHRDLAGLRLVECLCDPCHGRRLPQQIRQDDEVVVGVQITKSGRECFRSGDEALWVGPGDLVIWTSDQPTEFTVTERLHKVSLILPWSELRERLPRGIGVHGSVLDGRSGIGAVLYSHIDALSRQLDVLGGGDLPAVRRATLELLTAALSCDADAAPQPLSRQYLRRLQDYVLDHLQDEDLSPTSIAQAHHISPRYLHLLFAQTGQSVSSYIRQQRLERCRETLANPAHRERSVAEIAYQWGFSDPAHFSRIYKRQFGRTPGEQRR